MDKALAFYQALGFQLAERWGPPFAIVERAGLRLWLSGKGTSARKEMPDGTSPAPGGWNRLVVEVDDIGATRKLLADQGYHFRNEILDGPGGQQVLVEDPSGNPVELFQVAQ